MHWRSSTLTVEGSQESPKSTSTSCGYSYLHHLEEGKGGKEVNENLIKTHSGTRIKTILVFEPFLSFSKISWHGTSKSLHPKTQNDHTRFPHGNTLSCHGHRSALVLWIKRWLSSIVINIELQVRPMLNAETLRNTNARERTCNITLLLSLSYLESV